MRTFSAVARHQSFTGGAKELGLSTKVASNQVRALEAKLGVQLFNRTTRRVSLTDTGEAYYARVVPLLDQFDEAESVVQTRQAELAGPIRITAPTGFGSVELVAALAPFLEQHPKVEIDLRLADHHVNIVEDGIDLAIRFGTLADSTLMARKLLDMRMVVYAAPSYLAAHGEPKHPSALATHTCLRQQFGAESTTWAFMENGKPLNVRVGGSFRANSPRAVAQMAVTGVGIGRTPMYVAKPFIEKGELTLLFEDFETPGIPLHALYPSTRHLVARIRALIDHLAQTLAQ